MRREASLVAIAVGALLFGEFAQVVAQTVVCEFGALKTGSRESCGEAKAETLMIGALFTALIAILGGLATQRALGEQAGPSGPVVAAALTGGLISIVVASRRGGDFIDPRLIGLPLLVFAGCVAVFLLPRLLLRGGRAPSLRRELGVAVALGGLVGALAGFPLQLVADVAASGGLPTGASKFVVAPSATVIGGGICGAGLLFPWLAARRAPGAGPARTWRWLLPWAGLCLALAFGYGALFYHDRPWLPAEWGRLEPGLLTAALLLPGLTALAAVAVASGGRPSLGATLLAAALAAALGAAAGVRALALRVAAGIAETGDTWWFAPTHAAAAVAVVLVVPGAVALARSQFEGKP